MNFKTTLWLNYLRPNIFVKDISQIDIHSLKTNGIKLVICDLDNTLVPHFNKFPNKYVFDFINKIKREGLLIIIASNNTKKRVTTFVNQLQKTISVDGFLYNCKKPFTRKIRKEIGKFNITYNDVVVIGDQFITDIFLANRLKCKSILVLPMVDSNKSVSSNLLLKILENFIYKKLQHEKYIDNKFDNGKINDEIELL